MQWYIFSDSTYTTIIGMGQSGNCLQLEATDPRVATYTTAQNAISALSQAYATAIQSGCQIVSTSTPSLNGTYPINAQTIQNIEAEGISLLVNSVFTNGTITMVWDDINNGQHTFTIAEWQSFQKAIGAYVTALDQYANGIVTSPPTQPVTIP